jgi:hypothetical protein
LSRYDWVVRYVPTVLALAIWVLLVVFLGLSFIVLPYQQWKKLEFWITNVIQDK